MRNFILVLLALIILWGCVSVQLPSTKSSRSKVAVLKAPSKPYQSIPTDQADQAWMSDKTGNTISAMSECGNPNDLSLEQLETELLSSLSQIEKIKVEDTFANERKARLSIYKGQLDGVNVQISFLIFKKNGCNYSLSYGGIAERFTDEENIFQQFIQNYRVP